LDPERHGRILKALLIRVTLPPKDSPRRFAVRCATATFAAGLLVALATSAGIAGERITEGDPGVALAVNAIATSVAIVVLVFTMRPLLAFLANDSTADPDRSHKLHPAVLVLPQVFGAVIGIAVVHVALHREVIGLLPWLSERPAQFVNDIVAVAGLLALVWATANRLDTRLFVAALLVMTAYRATSPAWHLDQSPHGFQTTIQQLILAQFAAAAFGLLVFRATLDR
jgi:hypothetical protein